jgi:hypothetical protein
MEEQDAWVKVLGQKAKVQRRLYAVMVHGVRKTDVDTVTDIKATIRTIQAENRPLHGFLDLHRVAWPRQAREIEKTHGSLIMEVATSAQANRMIKEGVSIGAEIKICELFARECRLSQCFNCHQYGHIAPKCRGATRCGHCARDHPTRDCNFQGMGPPTQRCGACGTPGHTAWSDDCSLRQKERLRVKYALANKQTLYWQEEKPTPAPLPQASSQTANPTTPAGIYHFASNKKPRLTQNTVAPRRGRPTNASKANPVTIVVEDEAMNDAATIIPATPISFSISPTPPRSATPSSAASSQGAGVRIAPVFNTNKRTHANEPDDDL